MRKQFSWFETALIIVILSAYIYAACSDAFNLPNRWFIRDDAYYYYKVAQNISEGHGSTFDGINPTNGYHPLWMLICIPIFAARCLAGKNKLNTINESFHGTQSLLRIAEQPRQERIRHSNARPGPGHSATAGRPRRGRHRANRHRQNPRVRHPHH